MALITAYMYPEHRHELYKMLLVGGYVRQTHKVRMAATSQYVMDFMNQPVQLAVTPEYMFTDKIPAASIHKVQLELPALMTHMPDHFKLPTWGHILTNIVLHNIVPQPPHSYPSVATLSKAMSSVIQQRIDENVTDYERKEAEAAIGETLQIVTAVRPQDLPALRPILNPQDYYDNRPDPTTLASSSRFNDMLLGPGPVTPWTYCWHVQHVERSAKHIPLADTEIDLLLAIADYWHIVPVKFKTQAAQLAIVLEALHYKLLVPTPVPLDTLDTLIGM